ncbi:class I SAM-dependent methyltransferase [Aeromicrobium sp. CF4.19]|uniref:class I SAM-dependent methyltransferase n=1 Tax=Aeromicrobium sp. CF4.19 TaxID=3373082 RepID=UPI003EE45E2F
MSWWNDRVLPHVVERSCGNDMLRPSRERACQGLRGRVLELGFGSGLNVTSYPAEVTEVLAVEPSDRAWELSGPRRAATAVPVRRIGLDGARVELETDSADAVLSTFTLCTIPDVDAALAEAHRVLRPGGALHVSEHGLSPDASVARWQHRLDGLQRRLVGGCHLTRDPAGLLHDHGFEGVDLESGYLPTPAVGRPWSWTTTGTARATSP